MNAKITTLCFLLVVLSAIGHADYSSSADVESRRQSMKELAIKAPNNFSGDALAIVEAGLSDSDAEVRNHASAALWRYSVAKKYFKNSPEINLKNNSKLLKQIFESLADTDKNVRGNLVSTLMGIEPDSEIEEHLIKRFKEENEGEVRSKIVQALILGKYETDGSKEIMVSAIQDNHPEVCGWSAKWIMMKKEKSALPHLVKGLTSESKFVRNNCSKAISSFKNDAKPFIPEIKKLKGKVKNKEIESSIEETLESLNP